jgi:hypothetical protein
MPPGSAHLAIEQLAKEAGMATKPTIRRLFVALIASLVFNSLLIVVTSVVDPEELTSSSILGQVLNVFETPVRIFAEWFVPPGHSGIQVLLFVVSSVVFYAVVAWVGLTACGWPRSRQPNQDRSVSKSL